ncbi:MAG: fumarylacetoacetate hydrolase family protein [Rhodospirillales bacterium]
MPYALDPPPQASLPVIGGEATFPVRRVYCCGLNYARHAREMGIDATQPPIFFLKPADNVINEGGRVPYPPATEDLQYEIELVVAIARGGRDISPANAPDHVFGYAAGIDLTRRDRQRDAQASRMPWEASKTFDAAAPVSAIRPVADTGHPAAGRIWLAVDGETRQESDIADMIWPVPQVIAHLSTLFTLAPGDLLFTGTPEGVGPVSRGQRITGGVDGVGELAVEIV